MLWVTSSGITYNKYKTWVDVFSFLSNSPLLCHMPTICSASLKISWLLFPVYFWSAFLPFQVTHNIVCNVPFICISLLVPANDPTSYYTRLDWSGKRKRTGLRHLVNFWQHRICSMGCLHSNFHYMWPTHFPISCSRHSHYNRMKNNFNLVKAVPEALSLEVKRLGCQLTCDPYPVPGLGMSAAI
jgi:hypothetical protein